MDNIGTKVIRFVIIVVVGVYLYFMNEGISSRNIGIFMIVLGVSYLLYDLKRSYFYFSSAKDQEPKMRSNKEKFIARYFKYRKIKFNYEKPLVLGTETVRPDFYLPEFNVYVEYWGRDKREANNEYFHKKKLYNDNDIKIVDLYPDNLISFGQLDWKFTERLLNLLKKVD